MSLAKKSSDALSTVSDTSFWDKKRNIINTTLGKWVGGEDIICHGYNVMDQLHGNISYIQMLILSATGRLVDQKLAQWIEGNFIGMSYPDARIWCNQVGALAGTCQTSIAAATVAGCLAGDSRAYGCQTYKIAMQFIQRALSDHHNGQSVADIIRNSPHKKGQPDIVGFARPINRVDERIKPYEKLRKQCGFTIGKHLSLAFKLDAHLLSNNKLGMNAGGYVAAFLADQGFTADEIYQLKSLVVGAGVMACAIDNKKKGTNTFLPQRCDDIEYQGAPARTLKLTNPN